MEKIIQNDIEILKIVSQSENIREALLIIYSENKNPPTHSYKRVSKLMIEYGVKFKNGETYVHPSLQSLYEQNKDKKAVLKFS